ncbi:MAG: Npun_R2821/Npun_R2822 family protein [Microcystaceae cyanobacterium]
MASRGIYTLANDVVYDQLVALLNSIEVNVSDSIPICVIPYDDRLDLVKKEVESRPNVTLFDNQASLDKWDQLFDQVWSAHPREKDPPNTRPRWYKSRPHLKFASFDGDFDEFAFYEADNLAMKPLERLFDLLQDYDLVFDDWERNKSLEVAALDIPLIEKCTDYQEETIRPLLHDGSFFGGKKGLFTDEILADLKHKLINENEVMWVNTKGWWFDDYLFNYLTFRIEASLFNFTLSSNGQERTGNCAEVDPFVSIDNILYNEQGQKPIHRIHYMKYSSQDFANLCKGIDANICYKDVFLHYRFLRNPEQKPTQLKPPSLMSQFSKKMQKLVSKVKRLQSN